VRGASDGDEVARLEQRQRVGVGEPLPVDDPLENLPDSHVTLQYRCLAPRHVRGETPSVQDKSSVDTLSSHLRDTLASVPGTGTWLIPARPLGRSGAPAPRPAPPR